MLYTKVFIFFILFGLVLAMPNNQAKPEAAAPQVAPPAVTGTGTQTGPNANSNNQPKPDGNQGTPSKPGRK